MSEYTNAADPKPPSIDRLSLLWRRINDHKMVQWSVAYVALAYGVQHAVTLITEAFEWPHAVERLSMLLLALGLPLVMTLAWYHGARASRRISGPELTIIAILLVMSSLLFFVFVRPSEPAATPSVQQARVAAARAAAASPKGAISLAVLPFVNLSSDKEQEFFSDGMTEEITSALAKIPNLRVVARTSAFQFKGENRDVQTIAQALHATHLIEGSVRKDGNQLRITAQLIQADDGTHLWTESYDRELKGVFAIQEEIAQAIAGALRVPLGLKPGDNLVRDRANDLESYDQYLRARALVRTGEADAIAQASKLLEQVVARDPRFAPGWALLAQAYSNLTGTGSLEELRRFAQQKKDRTEMAAREAIRLDSRNAIAYAALARNQAQRDNRIAAEDLFKQALTLDANDPEVLADYCAQLSVTGRLREAANLCLKMSTLDPLIPQYRIVAATALQLNGQNQAATSTLEAIPAGTVRNLRLARSYAAEGRFAEAADTLLLINDPSAVSPKSLEDAARLLRTAPKKVSAPESLPILRGALEFVYAYVGAPDRVLDSLELDRQAVQTGMSASIWLPLYSPLRKSERFKAMVRQGGLVDLWRAKGWPDLCHPVGVDDFVCD